MCVLSTVTRSIVATLQQWRETDPSANATFRKSDIGSSFAEGRKGDGAGTLIPRGQAFLIGRRKGTILTDAAHFPNHTMKIHLNQVGDMAGFAAENAKGGDTFTIMVRARLTSDDPDFYQYSE